MKGDCDRHGAWVRPGGESAAGCPTCERIEWSAVLLAIDPGRSGGVAWIDRAGVVRAVPMPEGMSAQVDLLRRLTDAVPLQELEAWMEKTGTHVQGNSASASAKFARHCGHLEAALYALRVPVRQVVPGKWMRSLGALPGDKKARKAAIREEMARRHPHLRVTLKVADALGVLSWAERRREE